MLLFFYINLHILSKNKLVGGMYKMKKLTALIIALALALALVPMAALAEETAAVVSDDLIVDGKLLAKGDAITLAKGGWVSRSVDGNTITLNNAHFSDLSNVGCMIKYQKSLTINLVGASTMYYKSANQECITGISVEGDLAIKGSGSLSMELYGQNEQSVSIGAVASGKLTIEDAAISVNALGGMAGGIMACGMITVKDANITARVVSCGYFDGANARCIYSVKDIDIDNESVELGDVKLDGSHLYLSAASNVSMASGIAAGNLSMKRTYIKADAVALATGGEAYGLRIDKDLDVEVASRLEITASSSENMAAGIYCKGIANLTNSRADINAKTTCYDNCTQYCGAFGMLLHYADFDNAKIKINADRNCYCLVGTVGGVSADYLGLNDTALTVNASSRVYVQGNAGMELKQLVIEGSSAVRVNADANCDGVLMDIGRGMFTIEDGRLNISAGRLGLAGVNCDMFFNGGSCDIKAGIAAIVGASDGYESSINFAKKVGVAASGIVFAFDSDGCFTLIKTGSPFGVFVTDGAISAVTGAVNTVRIARGYSNAPVMPTVVLTAAQ